MENFLDMVLFYLMFICQGVIIIIANYLSFLVT